MRYIGCKRLLLENIENVINENVHDAKVFCDIFSGTGTVAEYFKNKFNIISNDFLYFSYVIQKAKIENNCIPQFKEFTKKYNKTPLDVLKNIENECFQFDDNKFFIKNNYSEIGNRMYLTSRNAEIIDKWRILIEEWHSEKIINDSEYYYLVACVVSTVPFYSNISGTYGAFLKTWDKRALKNIELEKVEVKKGSNNNKVYNENSDELISKISGDILYIDPPYNERQYLPNYHLLETVARYDYPVIKGVTGMRGYEKQKSAWCKKGEALLAFENMIKNASFKHIILSYNTDGIMSINEIESIMKKYGKPSTFKLYTIDYNRFKSRALVNTSKLQELLFYIQK